MKNVYQVFVWVLLAALVACGENPNGHASSAPQIPLVAAYLTGAEIQAETPEQRQIIHKALDDMLLLSSEDMRQLRYGPDQKTLPEVLRSHLVPLAPVAVTDDDFYNHASDVKVREAIKSLSFQFTVKE